MTSPHAHLGLKTTAEERAGWRDAGLPEYMGSDVLDDLDTALARLAEVERERDEAREQRDHWMNEFYARTAEMDERTAELARLAEVQRWASEWHRAVETMLTIAVSDEMASRRLVRDYEDQIGRCLDILDTDREDFVDVAKERMEELVKLRAALSAVQPESGERKPTVDSAGLRGAAEIGDRRVASLFDLGAAPPPEPRPSGADVEQKLARVFAHARANISRLQDWPAHKKNEQDCIDIRAALASLSRPAEPREPYVLRALEEAVAAIDADMEPTAWNLVNDALRIYRARPAEPDADGNLSEGIDFALMRLCDFLGVDPGSVRWDAATETVEGDVSAVIGNILRAHFGEEWGPR